MKQSTAIQTSLDNLKDPLSYKESNLSADTIDSFIDIPVSKFYSNNSPTKMQSIKTVSSLVSNLEPLIARYKPTPPNRSPVQHQQLPPPRIRFNEIDQYFVPSSIPNSTSVSHASSADTLDNKVNVNYNYYTSTSNTESGFKLLCNECAQKALNGDDFTNRIRTTISEESLSGCSISENGDYKIKSVTIRIGKPYYI